MDKQTILGKLPPFADHYKLIHPDQSVSDIITELLDAHKIFGNDYNKIALCFDADSPEDICKNILRFCRSNFVYDEQSEGDQMTMSPAAMIHLKKVDCKNYAGFCGGILDGLNRLTERKINWCYRFASYNWEDSTPHHVFVVINPGSSKELWFDPTPGSQYRNPIWQTDKKIKISGMALHRVSGIQIDQNILPTSGKGLLGLIVSSLKDQDVINYDGSHKYSGVFGKQLSLSAYSDYESAKGTNWDNLAAEINSLIASGPDPGHSIDANFVKWVFDQNLRGWNFYYEGGVNPVINFSGILPVSWPVPVLGDDGRLTLSNNTPVDDYRNAEIHILTAWLQQIINETDPSPYPITPKHVKEFSQQNNSPLTGNIYEEPRGSSIFQDIGEALKKFGLSAPRNAYLGLIGINAFGMATNLKNAIYNQDGSYSTDGYNRIKNAWESFGGNWQKLENTINEGAKHKAILGSFESKIGVAPAIPIWLATAGAIIAMISPIVKDILKTKQQQTGIDFTINPATGMPFPEPVIQTGGNIINWIKLNPIPSLAIAFILYKVVTGRRKLV